MYTNKQSKHLRIHLPFTKVSLGCAVLRANLQSRGFPRTVILCSMGRLWVLLPLQCWLWAVSIVFFSGAKWNSSVRVAEERKPVGLTPLTWGIR